MSQCIICGSKKLKRQADDMRMRCDTVECIDCGVLCPATPWRDAEARIAMLHDIAYRAGRTFWTQRAHYEQLRQQARESD